MCIVLSLDDVTCTCTLIFASKKMLKCKLNIFHKVSDRSIDRLIDYSTLQTAITNLHVVMSVVIYTGKQEDVQNVYIVQTEIFDAKISNTIQYLHTLLYTRQNGNTNRTCHS